MATSSAHPKLCAFSCSAAQTCIKKQGYICLAYGCTAFERVFSRKSNALQFGICRATLCRVPTATHANPQKEYCWQHQANAAELSQEFCNASKAVAFCKHRDGARGLNDGPTVMHHPHRSKHKVANKTISTRPRPKHICMIQATVELQVRNNALLKVPSRVHRTHSVAGSE